MRLKPVTLANMLQVVFASSADLSPVAPFYQRGHLIASCLPLLFGNGYCRSTATLRSTGPDVSLTEVKEPMRSHMSPSSCMSPTSRHTHWRHCAVPSVRQRTARRRCSAHRGRWFPSTRAARPSMEKSHADGHYRIGSPPASRRRTDWSLHCQAAGHQVTLWPTRMASIVYFEGVPSAKCRFRLEFR